MNILKDLIIRSVLIIALNDGIVFYVIRKRSMKLTLILTIEIIIVTCIAMVINIWYVLYLNGIV